MAFLRKIFGRKSEEKPVDRTKYIKAGDGAGVKAGTGEAVVKKEGVILGVLRAPHITEKTSNLQKKNKYAFLINPRVNKIEVKRAVRSRYDVNAVSVNILNMPGKERRRGRQIGWKPGFKKAIVTLKEGQSIEIQ